MSSTKEITESLGLGVVAASLKAAIDYFSVKKVSLYSAGKITVIAAAADLVIDYGKKGNWWPWM